jgi:hypothetical protein
VQPDDVSLTLTLVLHSADARAAAIRRELAELEADRRAKRQELADAERLREDAVRAILGQTPPRLFPEPGVKAPASPPAAVGAPDDGDLRGWRDCPVGDLGLSDRRAEAARRSKLRTVGKIADALRAGAAIGLTPGEVNLLRIGINGVAGDDPDFDPLEPPPAPKPCRVCDADIPVGDWGYESGLCSTRCQRDLEAGGEPEAAAPAVKGEDIAGLGLTAADLDAAVCAGAAWGKGGKPAAIKAVEVDGRPHAVLSSVGVGGVTEAWTVRPLWTEVVFAQRHPDMPLRVKPGGLPGHYYTGLRVRVGKAELVVGGSDSERRLIAAKSTPKRKAGAK